MRIAITLLSGIVYGGATYFRNLLPALARAMPRDELHCVVQEAYPLASSMRASNITFHSVLPSNASAIARFRYEQFVLPQFLNRIHADVLYTAKNIAVLRTRCPQVIAIRNMEPFAYRAFANPWMHDARSRVRWELTKRSIARADVIVAVSQAVRDAMTARFPSAARKISVVYNGTPTVHLPTTSFQPHAPPFLLTASKFVPYANQLALVEAYAQLLRERSDAPELHVAGGIHDVAYFARVQRRIRDLGIGSRVRMLGLIAQDDLHARMRAATAFIFPSMLESCPHTLLEAMACGVPIATASVPPMPELCGDAAVYFDPRDHTTMMRAMVRLLDDATLRGRLITAGRERVQQFTWEKTARGLLDAFLRVGDRLATGNRQS